MLRQEFHLIDKNAAVREDQVFRAIRHVRRVDQLHACLLGCAIAFALVAGSACGDDVHPGVPPAARERLDMVSRQPHRREHPTAICTQMPVAMKKLPIVQGRYVVERPERHRLTLDRNDARRTEMRPPARDAVDAAVDRERRRA